MKHPWWWYPSWALVPVVWAWLLWDETAGREVDRLREGLDLCSLENAEYRDANKALQAEVERLRKMVPKVKNAQEIVEEVRRALPVDDELRRKLLTADTLLRMAGVDSEKASRVVE